MTLFDPIDFREQFPLLGFFTKGKEGKLNNVYFDNAATTQKPCDVIDAQQQYYQRYNANVHRASHKLSAQATFAFEQARTAVQQFIHAKNHKEIIWTKGATESINLVAQSLGSQILKPLDEIVLTESEHHANIVPWQIVAKKTGAVIKVLPLTEQGIVDITVLDKIITSKVKIVAFSHVSNVLGKFNPVKQIIKKAKEVGAYTLVDGAQAVAHVNVDVQVLDCDFYVFSAHKMFGPTGVGVLYGKEVLLNSMEPYQGGGEMIKQVSFTSYPTFNELPFKFEAGTPNISAIIAFAKAIDFLQPYLDDKLNNYSLYEKKLTDYCYQALNKIFEIKFITINAPDIGVIAFTVFGHHNHDIATALDSYGIAVRSGHHCAMPLMNALQLDGCLRVSLAAYNTFTEVDYFIECLHKILTEKEIVLIKRDKQSDEAINQIQERFLQCKSWDGRHREIMLLGKNLNRLDRDARNEQSLISGCESKAWLVSSLSAEGKYTFNADSDAKTIRGLLVIVLAAYNNKTAQQVNQFDITEYFSHLGLVQHLSPSRGNGLLAIVDKIKCLIKE